MKVFKDNFQLDFQKVKYEDVKINTQLALKNICQHSLFQHILMNLIPLTQLYYLNKATIINSIATYCLAYFSLKILFSCIEYYNEVIMRKLSEKHFQKLYYEMGDIFRKTVIVSQVINLLFYFPFVLMFNWFISLIPITNVPFLTNSIFAYHKINFFTLLFVSFNTPLINMLHNFKKFKLVNMCIFIKFIVNSAFCKYFKKIDPEWYFLNGIAYADLISEVVTCICLIFIQYYSNPYPQAWIRLNLKMFSFAENFSFFMENFTGIKSLMAYLAINVWNEFLIFAYIILSANFDIENLVFLILLNNLFFCTFKITKRNTIKDLSDNFFENIYPNNNNSLTTNLINDNLKPTNDKNKIINKNYESFSLIKTKILCSFITNFILFLAFLILYFLNIFRIIFDQKLSFILILLIAINGIIHSIMVELYLIINLLHNQNHFYNFFVGYILISFPIFFIFTCFQDAPFFLLISFYSGCYYLVFVFYKLLIQADMRIININKINSINI